MNSTEAGQPLGLGSSEGLGVTGCEERMKCIDPDMVTDEMIAVGGALLSRLLYSYDVVGGWPDDEVLPDVFRAMLSAAPVHGAPTTALQQALSDGKDTSGLCTVREFAQYVHEAGAAESELYFDHEGRRWNVELRITRVVDVTPNVRVEAGPAAKCQAR